MALLIRRSYEKRMEDGGWRMEDFGRHCWAMLLLMIGTWLPLYIKAFRRKAYQNYSPQIPK
jgi:hypothetical protein